MSFLMLLLTLQALQSLIALQAVQAADWTPTPTSAVPPMNTNPNPWHLPESNVGQNKHFAEVDSDKLQREVHITGLMEHLRAWEMFAYATPERNRHAGGDAHNRTLAYIREHLEALGGYYDIEEQPFHARVRVSGNIVLHTSDTGASIDGDAFSAYGWGATYARRGNYTGDLVAISGLGCDESDYPPKATHNIALAGVNFPPGARTNCSVEEIAAAAAARDVRGIVLGPLVRSARCDGNDTLPQLPSSVPGIIVGWDTVRRLRNAVDVGGVRVRLAVHDVPCKDIWSHNLVATSRMGSENDTLMLGAHTDSVASGPGINDNGSGSAALLELAVLLAKYQVRNRVRFAWWTAEESGLLGSRQWVAEAADEGELARIRLYLNFDMIGSPNFKIGAYDGTGKGFGRPGPLGSDLVQVLFDGYFARQGWNTSGSAFDGRSDYGPFIEAGVPAGGVFTGADALKTPGEAVLFGGRAGEPFDRNYHMERDDVANVNRTALVLNTRAIAHALATYAHSFMGFPPRGAAHGLSGTESGTRMAAADSPLVLDGICGGHGHLDLDGPEEL